MDSSLSFNQETHIVSSETSFPVVLLERGLDCFRQGRYVEGTSLCTRAREGFSPKQLDSALVIDAFLEGHARYWRALQTLQEASRRFVEAETEQQTLLLDVARLCSGSREEMVGATSESHHLSQSSDGALELRALHSQPQIAAHIDGEQPPQPLPPLPQDLDVLPALSIMCFGRFEVKRLGQPIMLCRSRSAQAILRFLVAQPGHRASVDRLMDVLWAQDTPEIARRKLQIAISLVRSSLNSGYHCRLGEGYILCIDGFYQLTLSTTIRTDVEDFLSLWQAGQRTSGSEAAACYERACALCSGPFLVEDTYADWSSTRREQLKQIYVTMCHALAGYYLDSRRFDDAVKWTSSILSEDRCNEAAHRQLIQIYIAQGRRSEALKQYYRCEQILSEELNVSPMPETTSLLGALLISTDLPLHKKTSTE